MIIERKFVYGTDDEYGTTGWMPAWMRGANALGHEIVAHDVMEHLSNDSCQYVDELQALGASIYIRSETGWYSYTMPNNINETWQHLGSTLHLDIIRASSGNFRAPPRTVRLDDETEDEMTRAVDEAFRLTHSEMHEEDRLALPLRDVLRQRMIGWMRIGYRAARKAFPDQHGAMQMYRDIGKAVRYFGGFEGQEITVRVNSGAMKFSVKSMEGEY